MDGDLAKDADRTDAVDRTAAVARTDAAGQRAVVVAGAGLTAEALKEEDQTEEDRKSANSRADSADRALVLMVRRRETDRGCARATARPTARVQDRRAIANVQTASAGMPIAATNRRHRGRASLRQHPLVKSSAR